jgi:hypothetical protein
LFTIGLKLLNTHSLIDYGAIAIAFADNDFVRHSQLEENEFKESGELEIMDGRAIESGTITIMAKLDIGIKSHQEQLPVIVTNLRHCPIGLGLLWLQLDDVTVKYNSCQIGFECCYCQQHCQYHSSIWVWENDMETISDPEQPKLYICSFAASTDLGRMKMAQHEVYGVCLYEINNVIGIMNLQEKPSENVFRPTVMSSSRCSAMTWPYYSHLTHLTTT